MRLRARTLLTIALAASLAVVAVAAAVAPRGAVIDAGIVPGVGLVSAGGLTAEQRPTVRVPAARPLTEQSGARSDAIANSAYAEARPGRPDRGDPAAVAAIKRSLPVRLFLTDAAYACQYVQPAAFVTLAHVYTAPALRYQLSNLESTRRAFPDDENMCTPRRLRIGAWRGVQVAGDRARAVLTGRRERLEEGEWESERFEARALLRRVSGQWKLSALAEENLDYQD